MHKVKSFTLKQKDFSSGKMVSPPREFWLRCACCGKLIVQGAVMSNGDKIGNDCEEILFRAKNGDSLKLFCISKIVEKYIEANIKAA